MTKTEAKALSNLIMRDDEVSGVLSRVVGVLEEWFDLVEGMDVRERSEVWARGEIGRVIKGRLERMGHWKRLPRGNPGKGYRVMRGGGK